MKKTKPNKKRQELVSLYTKLFNQEEIANVKFYYRANSIPPIDSLDLASEELLDYHKKISISLQDE